MSKDYNKFSKQENNDKNEDTSGINATPESTKENITEKDQKPEETKKQFDGSVKVLTHKLYVRKSPNSKGERVCMVSKKDILKVKQKLPKWYQVETEEGEVGYVMKEFVKVV